MSTIALSNEETEHRIVDPILYHAKPKDFDISEKALKRPRISEAKQTNYIFKQESFEQFNNLLPSRLVEILQKDDTIGGGGLGLATTTKIQSVMLPLLLDSTVQYSNKGIVNSNKILIKSQTGSGKTLAYLIPIIATFIKLNQSIPGQKILRQDGIRALILVPTRELCNQVTNICEKLVNYCCCNVVIGSVTGGEKRKTEKAKLRKGLVIVIATPGRFLDHLRTTECINLKYLQFIVLDEVDKLLELGECTLPHATNHTQLQQGLINNHNAVYEILKIILQGMCVILYIYIYTMII